MSRAGATRSARKNSPPVTRQRAPVTSCQPSAPGTNARTASASGLPRPGGTTTSRDDCIATTGSPLPPPIGPSHG